MPELPEIEHLRRTLEGVILGGTVRRVRLLRADILHRPNGTTATSRIPPVAGELLLGATITALDRRGKQLAILTDRGPVLCVHLGMSGQLHYVRAGQRPPRRDHVHCMWWIDTRHGSGRLVFRDPRRFGGLWTFASMDRLRLDRWSRLGPDALTISAAALHRRLRGTRRYLKAALLDQSLLCGLGNIYVDEALFAARIHPCSVSPALPPRHTQALASAIRTTLRCAIRAGGSTFRDYLDGRGQPGRYTARHQVYGRAGSPCLRCGRDLERQELGQRTTVSCSHCQRLFL